MHVISNEILFRQSLNSSSFEFSIRNYKSVSLLFTFKVTVF